MLASQARCRGFDPRRPLHLISQQNKEESGDSADSDEPPLRGSFAGNWQKLAWAALMPCRGVAVKRNYQRLVEGAAARGLARRAGTQAFDAGNTGLLATRSRCGVDPLVDHG